MTRPELSLVPDVAGVEPGDGPPCALCGRPVNHWADLCDACNLAILELADSIGDPR